MKTEEKDLPKLLPKPKNLIIISNHDLREDTTSQEKEREKGFRLRVRASLGGKFDKQGWPCIQGTINNGDTYAISAASGVESLVRIRRPHKEVSKEDFKLAVTS